MKFGTLEYFYKHILGAIDLLVFKDICGLFGELVSKWSVTRKQLTAERKGVNLGHGDGYNINMGCLWPFSVQGHLGVIRCTCLKKMAGHKAKRSEMWDSGLLSYVHGTPLTFQCSRPFWGSFGVLVSKWPGTRQRLAIEWSRMKLGLGVSCKMYRGYFWPLSVQGHFGVIWSTCL